MVIKHPPTNQPADLHIHTNTPVTLRCDCGYVCIYILRLQYQPRVSRSVVIDRLPSRGLNYTYLTCTLKSMSLRYPKRSRETKEPSFKGGEISLAKCDKFDILSWSLEHQNPSTDKWTPWPSSGEVFWMCSHFSNHWLRFKSEDVFYAGAALAFRQLTKLNE